MAAPSQPSEPVASDRLDSWKEIAAHFRRGERTVRRWEQTEGLPVHRHAHLKRGSVYAYRPELDAWWASRKDRLEAKQPPAPARVRAPWLLAAVVLSVAVGVAGVLVWRHTGTDRSPGLKSVPVTSYVGLEIFPSLSPDGERVVFAWNGDRPDNFDLYIQPVAGGTPRRVTSDPADETSPAWSPDGQSIAFLRLLPQGRAAVLVMQADGSGERRLIEIRPPGWRFWWYGPYLAWSPDGKWLAVVDKDSLEQPSALFLVSVETGERRRLTSPPQNSGGDASPTFSPTGEGLAFIRTGSRASGELYVLALTRGLQPGGAPRQLTSYGQLTASPVWTSGGGAILFVSRERWATCDLWKIRVSPPSANRSPNFSRPERITSLEERADVLTVSRTSPDGRPRLVYNRGIFDPNIWRVELDGSKAKSAPFISSTRVENAPRFSRDGTKIAFQSSRSGKSEIWVCNGDGSNPVQLTSGIGAGTGFPSWSPDGQRLVFNSSVQGQADLYVVHTTGGTPRRLTHEPFDEDQASWSRDGRWIYFHSNRTGESQVWKMPAQGGDSLQVTRNGGFTVQESPDGAYLYYSKASRTGRSVWRMLLASGTGGREEQVVESIHEFGTFTVADRGVYFVQKSHPTGGASIQFLDLASGKTRTIIATDRPIVVGLTVSPDGRTILYTQVDREDSDLMLLQNLRPEAR